MYFNSHFNKISAAIWCKEYTQVDTDDCGVCCLAYLLRRYKKRDLSLEEVKNYVTYFGGATSVSSLISYAKKLGTTLTAYKSDESFDINEINFPAVLHLKKNHFVVLASRVGKNDYEVFDPARGSCVISKDQIELDASGVFLEFQVNELNPLHVKEEKYSLGDIFKELKSYKWLFFLVIFFAFISQVISLLPIFITQKIVDGLSNHNASFYVLSMIVICVTLIAGEVLSSYARGVLVNKLSIYLSLDAAKNVLNGLWDKDEEHLIVKNKARLVKDFDSINIIRNIICNEFVALMINISTIIVALCMLIHFHLLASIVTILGAVIYIVFKFFALPYFVYLESENHVSKSNVDNFFYETIDQYYSTKINIFSRNRLLGLWNLYVKKIVAESRFNIYSNNFTVISIAIFGATTVISSAICFKGVIDGDISLGYAFAFIAVQQRFIHAASLAIEGLQTKSLYKICLDRLNFFVNKRSSYRNNESIWRPASINSQYKVRIKQLPIKSIKEKSLFINGEFDAGIITTITGPSGQGKSAILKKFVNVSSGEQGWRDHFEFLINDQRLQRSGSPKIAAIFQADRLFSGTIEENICFFSETVDKEYIAFCLKVCGLTSLISSLPYGIQTPVSPLSMPFSGGQVQRILIARALYAKPDILILDEATSDLDVFHEKALINDIKAIVETLIIVTHKMEIYNLGENRIYLGADRNE